MEERGKVVVIDDSPIVRKLAELALEEEGYKVYSAEDGEEGLRVAEEVLPEVILVDFIMPRMSGYQFCKMVRENERLRDIPIILITGKGEEAGKKFIEMFGVADFFVKPFKSETLVEKVTAIIQAQQALRPAVEELTPITVQEETVAAEALYGLGAEEGLQPLEAVEAEEIPETPEPYVLDTEAVEELSPVTVQEETVAAGALYGLGAEEGLQPQEVGLTEEIAETPEFDEEPLASAMGREGEGIGAGPEEKEEAMPSVSATPDMEETVDRVMWRYFYGEFPFLLQKSLSDILKQSGVIKTLGITLSGELSDVSLCDVLRLISNNRLTGKLFIYAPVMSSEVYFEEGSIAYASTSKQGRDPFSGKLLQKRMDIPADDFDRIFSAPKDRGLPAAEPPGIESDSAIDDLVARIKGRIYEALHAILGLRGGNFFFERMALPQNLSAIPMRLDTSYLILEGARRIDDGVLGTFFRDNDAEFMRVMTGVGIEELNLTGDELEVIRLVDNSERLGTMASTSGMEETKLKRILYTLTKAGIIKET